MSLLDNITTYIEDDITYYKMVDIGRLLGYQDYSKTYYNLPERYKKMVTRKEDKELQSRRNAYISLDGLKHIVINSRKQNASKLAAELNLDIVNTKFECLERQTLQIIKNIFKGENMIEQYQILTYRIDLYFVDYNLSIECDERGHNDRCIKYEQTRHKKITEKISCQWVRYNPNEHNFNIYDIVNRIFIIIKTKLN